ncbi:MAG: hypothetical protein LBR27_07765 [Bifidobacteriaceae bacterium]|jgi:hypothetical protein|nr:hypothetical protein [Bifidobacteriaceae bacterium]
MPAWAPPLVDQPAKRRRSAKIVAGVVCGAMVAILGGMGVGAMVDQAVHRAGVPAPPPATDGELVGTPEVGYIRLPAKWKKVVKQQEGTLKDNNRAQATYANPARSESVFLQTINGDVFDDEVTSTLMMLWGVKGATDVEAKNAEVDGLHAWKVDVTYPDHLQQTWLFDDDAGRGHIVTLEARRDSSDVFGTIRTFTLDNPQA